MLLIAPPSGSMLLEQWRAAIAPMVIRHPNRTSVVTLILRDDDELTLEFSLDVATCTVDPTKTFAPLMISVVTLCYFPGPTLARAWVTAAWAGYLLHESLELVTVDGVRPLDPHGETPAYDRGMRAGLPSRLTPEALKRALIVIMDADVANALVQG